MKRLFILYFVTLGWLYALPSKIERYIKNSGIPQKDISIYIKELDTNRVVASHHATRTRKPASVIKVLTTYASLLKLGFNYRWPTIFYTTGSLKGGVLNGNLIVKGFGDPTLATDDVEKIAETIRAEGIRKINGNIIIDRSYFNVGNKESAHFDKHPYSPYNAMPDAMMFNERSSRVLIIPQEKRVEKESYNPGYRVLNQIEFVNKPCRGRYAWATSRVDKTDIVPKLILEGRLSRYCSDRKVSKLLTKPYKAFYYALKEKLKERGVSVKGSLRLHKVPGNAKILFVHYSNPLEMIVSETAKESNNLYARHLLLYLGAQFYGAPATLKKGRRAVREILRYKGVWSDSECYIDNGSGLSRVSKISAKFLADIYEDAYWYYAKRWMETLSIAGVDGTLKKRFRRSVVKNRAWMKTGTIKGVKNIAGYVKSRKGRLYTVVILINTKVKSSKVSKLQDNIITWLIQSH